MRTFQAAIVLSAFDRMTRTVNAAFSNVQRRLADTQKASEKVARSAADIGRQAATVGMVAAAPLGFMTDKAMQFEDAMAGVGKVLDMKTGSEALMRVGKDVRVLSVELAQSQENVAALYASIAQGGVSADNLNRVSRIAGRMGVAFDMTSEIAGDKFIKIQNALGGTIDETERLANTMNYLSDKEAAKASQIVDFFSAGGAAATNMLKISPQVSAAFGTMFISAGKSGEEAATIFERFTKGVMKGGNEASRIFQSAGGGLPGLQKVLEKGRSLNGQDQFKFFQAFGEYGPEIAQMANNYKVFDRVLGEAMDTQAQANSVNKEFENRMSTTKTKFAQAKVQFNDVAITLGTQLLPVMTSLLSKASAVISKVAAWIDQNPRLAKGIMIGVAAFSALSIAVSGISFLVSGVATTISFASQAFGVMAKAIKFMGTAFSFVARLLMANPIILIVTAIAASAYLIYKNWDSIKLFFVNLWERVKVIFGQAWEFIKGIFLKYHPLGVLIKHWDEVKLFFAGLGTTMFNAGKNVILSIWEGMKAVAMLPVEIIKGIAQKVRDFLPFSPAKTGPLKTLHKVRLVETIADTMKPRPMVDAMRRTVGAAMPSAFTLGGGGSFGGGGSVSVNFAPVINMPGNANSEEGRAQMLAMFRQYQPELIRAIEEAVSRKNRKSF